MATPEQARAPHYPEAESIIELTPMDYGMLEAGFHIGVMDHGNDTQLTWRSYAEEDDEEFTVSKFGSSDASVAEIGLEAHKWVLSFKNLDKTLLIDTGKHSIKRYTGESLVVGTFQDISDTIAASYNLVALGNERRDQGMNPITEYLRNWDAE